ncbi:MAG: hypothetical protein A2289_04610 [Deltaproteobacteria bacterium RIFOXYA12_FULL_58_15]|nr:MAG: hypothetical protein A2289_04610 [Deltaproteobacteria bacterium RIFOXYA12_FULL_58_15]
MGHGESCKSCKDCSCDSAPEIKPSENYPHRRRDESRFLTEGQKGPEPDATPLEASCPHYRVGPATRSQCNTCIVAWVLAVGVEAAENVAAQYEGSGRRITADRIRAAIVRQQLRNIA